MPWQGGSNSVSHSVLGIVTSRYLTLAAKNRFPQGWAKAFCKYQSMHVHILWYSVSSIQRKGWNATYSGKYDKKLIQILLKPLEKVSKHYHWQKTLMLCVTGGIKTPLLQSLVSEQWAWFTNREERQRGRLIWSQSYRREQSGSFSVQEKRTGRGGGVRGGGWNGGIEKWHLWSGDLTWGNTINHEEEKGVATWFRSCIAWGTQSWGKWGDLKGRRDMGVIVSSTQSLWSPMWDCTIRVVCTVRSDCGGPEGSLGSDLPLELSMFHWNIQTRGVKLEIS